MKSSSFRHSLAQAIFAVALRPLALLPLSVLRALGRFYGSMSTLIQSRAARTTRTNLALCFPELSDTERMQLARRSLEETGCTIFEMAAIWFWKAKALEQLVVKFEGQELLDEKLAQGGVVCVCPHWGNWEITAHAIATRYVATALYDGRRLAEHTDRITRKRTRFGLTMASTEKNGLRILLSALKSSQLVVVMPDQVPTRGNNVIVDFMGVKARTTTMVQSLVRHTEAAVLLLTFERVPKGFHIRVELFPDHAMGDSKEIAAQTINDEIRRVIERDPAQYQWEYKRFRRLPGIDYYK